MSVASVWVRDLLQDVFPDLYAGHYNCRKISGSSRYSQHAWPNALDLTNVKYGYSTHPDNQAYLDAVAQYIWDNRVALSVKMMLWRGKSWGTGNPVSGHQNHIHVDFWPTGYGTPKCAGGTVRYQFSSGRVVYGDPGPENGMTELNDPRPTPPPPSPEEPGDYEMPTLELWAGYNSKGKGEQRVSVRALQIMLAHHGFADQMSADKTCAADGWFGEGTKEQVLAFQRDRNLKPDGVVGRLTWSALNA